MKNIYLLLIALSLSFSGFSQTTIYQENFEAFGNGAVTTSTTNSDIGAWNSSGTALCNGTTFWGIYDTGSGIITNRGLKPATATTACVISPGNYNLTSTVSNLYAYTTISTTGYTNISLEFDWKCTGEFIGSTIYDYGSVVYRVGTTGSWIQLTTGGTSVGRYYNNNPTTAPRAVVTLPATMNNLAKVQFGFRWDNDSSAGAAPAFSIDNIIVKGTPICIYPTTQATAYNTTNINSPSTGNATLNWTRAVPNVGQNVLVVMRAGSAVNANPNDGTSYTGSSNFTSGTQIGTGNYVVYNGAGTSVNVTGLSINTTYHVAVYEYTSATNCYKIPALTGNFTVPCVTPINVTALTATPANQQVALTWTNSACFDEVLVVAKANTAVTAVPTGNGSAYTADAAFGSGTAIASGEFVVYKNTGAAVTVTALTNNTTYHFKVFTRKGSVWSSGVVANATPALVYCAASGTMTFATSITLVNFAGINNVTAKPAGYNSYLAQIANVNKGANVPMNIRLNTDGNYNVYSYAFIDWNQDGDFLDTQETYDLGLVNNNANGLTSLSPKSINIPNFAVLGNTRMRVVCQYYTGTTPPTANSCATGIDGEVEDYTVNVGPPINYTYNNGWSPSDPNGQSTSLNNITIANGAAVISSNIGANTVTVNPTGALTVNTGNTLTVSNGLNLQSTSTQYSSLISNGTITGTVNYTRHVNTGSVGGVGGNDLISAPLSGQAFNLFKQANGNIKTNTAATLNLFGPFAKPSNVFLTYANGDTFPMTAGEGHRAASTDNGGFIFTGTVNTGTVNRSIENSGTGSFAPWNLIGNPYPSYLYVKEETGAGAHPGFLNANIGQFAINYVAIYGYDNDPSDGNNYTIWNLANTTSATVMTPGQGFFVVSDTGINSVNFTPGMRAIGSTDDFIAGRQGSDENNASLRLNLTNGTDNYVTDFYFNDASTLGLDPGYDAGLFGGSAPTFSIFSQLVEDNVGVNMAIQSLPYSSLGSEVVVPIGLRVTEGQQVTISSENNTIPSGVDVYLEDTVANTSTLISNSDYVFTAPSNLNGVGRFFLRFTNTTLSTTEVTLNGLQIYTTTTPRALFIKGQLAMATTVRLYDIQGRMVASSVLDKAANSQQVDVSNLSTGVYIVKLSNSAQQKTQKVILK